MCVMLHCSSETQLITDNISSSDADVLYESKPVSNLVQALMKSHTLVSGENDIQPICENKNRLVQPITAERATNFLDDVLQLCSSEQQVNLKMLHMCYTHYIIVILLPQNNTHNIVWCDEIIKLCYNCPYLYNTKLNAN